MKGNRVREKEQGDRQVGQELTGAGREHREAGNRTGEVQKQEQEQRNKR